MNEGLVVFHCNKLQSKVTCGLLSGKSLSKGHSAQDCVLPNQRHAGMLKENSLGECISQTNSKDTQFLGFDPSQSIRSRAMYACLCERTSQSQPWWCWKNCLSGLSEKDHLLPPKSYDNRHSSCRDLVSIQYALDT